MIVNFGRNVRFQPGQFAEPRSEEELLKLLSSRSSTRIRVSGARHAWSALIPVDDLCVSLNHFQDVRLTHEDNGRCLITVGGGCTIQRLLKQLNRHGLTLPTVSSISSQTIAGAVSTGSHGSGHRSLSHYLRSIRLAGIDSATGRAVVRTFDRGPEMAAARCGLGCLGVILSVSLYAVPQFELAECVQVVDGLDEALKQEESQPLQQIYLVPHLNRFYVAGRRKPRSWEGRADSKRLAYRFYRHVLLDIVGHRSIRLLTRLPQSHRLIRWFYRKVYPNVILRNVVFVDRSDRILTTNHHLCRHLETELFVSEKNVRSAVHFVQAAITAFADRNSLVPESFATSVREIGLAERLHQLRGSWTHHYPVCIRKVLPDDTLISMSAGKHPVYAISLVSFAPRHLAFRNFSSFMSKAMAELFQARPHWGKYFELPPATVRGLYPKFERFERIRQSLDADQRFSNAFIDALTSGESAE